MPLARVRIKRQNPRLKRSKSKLSVRQHAIMQQLARKVLPVIPQNVQKKAATTKQALVIQKLAKAMMEKFARRDKPAIILPVLAHVKARQSSIKELRVCPFFHLFCYPEQTEK
ncbi:MAG TPA: hypothetical protein DC042_07970 [Bacteroidales bacterium]|nr:hypothetical protein [Bacteroidales bacterium]